MPPELVAALSLGVDLGFGQPMEHVLRQCLIALRLADRIGLDEDERAVVYYTALLVNVGCRSDAHEHELGDDCLDAGRRRRGFSRTGDEADSRSNDVANADNKVGSAGGAERHAA